MSSPFPSSKSDIPVSLVSVETSDSLPALLSEAKSGAITEIIPVTPDQVSNQADSPPLKNPTIESRINPATNQGAAKWRVFTSTFITIFLAEMGDKTQIATLLMTAESHAPWIIFLGAATALIATSLVGVLLGRWLAGRLAPQTLDRAAALMLLWVAAMLIWEVIQ
ncbi:MAG: TMEM165/GDT1 family protein [Coleofasciculaceae cyanobacterium SM2_1_6]|nr:TMEM165/GDT1 family protein [Coleofasciculaceae cyanobacterium SM2_1_6]